MADRLFARPEPRVNFADFIGCLLSDVRRKNGWQVAAHAGHATPDRQQHLLARASWDADALRDLVREQVVTHLGAQGACEQAVLVVDETAALKKGNKSIGVGYHYAGVTGQVEHCQTMVMLTYATGLGHAYIDRSLYLPTSWTDDPARMAEAGVPEGTSFAAKPILAVGMLSAAIGAGVSGAVAADAVYGRDRDFRQFCHQHGLTYVVQVPSGHPVWTPAATMPAGEVPAATFGGAENIIWQRYNGGPGSKGLKYHDWAWIGGVTVDDGPAPGFEHALLVRRCITDPDDVTYLLAHAPAGTALRELIRIDAARWSVEEDNRLGKSEIGLDHYEVRKWTPWHRHITCAMFAAAFLAITRAAELGKEQAEADSD